MWSGVSNSLDKYKMALHLSEKLLLALIVPGSLLVMGLLVVESVLADSKSLPLDSHLSKTCFCYCYISL